MSMPPQGGWHPPQPGNTPPPPSVPYGPPPWDGRQPWPQLPGQPPQKGSGLKWLLIAVGLLLVVAITIGATLLFTRGSGDTAPTATSTSAVASDIASANDTGPVAIITSDPTCDAWNAIRASLAGVQGASRWTERDPSSSASTWSPEQRSEIEAVATSFRNAASQAVGLAKQTPHRVVRELYEQFAAYGRAYADRIPTYTSVDDFLALTTISIGESLGGLCDAITYQSAASRSLAVPSVPPPDRVAPVGNPAEPQRFVLVPDATCTLWVQREDRFSGDLAGWFRLDPNPPATQWTPDQKAIQQAAIPIFTSYADDIEAAGRQSNNPVLEDVAVLAAVYFRAYAGSVSNYVAADNYLVVAALRAANTISSACRATAK